MLTLKKTAFGKVGSEIEGVTKNDKLYGRDQNNSSFRRCTKWLSHCWHIGQPCLNSILASNPNQLDPVK